MQIVMWNGFASDTSSSPRPTGSVRTENKTQNGEPSCGILTVIEPVFIRSEP